MLEIAMGNRPGRKAPGPYRMDARSSFRPRGNARGPRGTPGWLGLVVARLDAALDRGGPDWLGGRLRRRRRGRLGGGGRCGRGVLAGALLAFDPAQTVDVLLMLVVVFREDVPANAVGDEIEILGARRIGGRLERGAARIADRPRRQAVDDVGVVRRRLALLALGDRVAEGAFAAGEAVDDGGIGLQLHLRLEPVDEHGGDARALLVAAGLLLDDRGEDDQFLRRLERQARRAVL